MPYALLAAALLASGLLALCGTTAALADGPDPYKATSSRAAREEAIRSIPFKQLDADGRNKVNAVVSDISVFRRMPTQVIRCDPDLYLFMVHHPDVTVNIWEVLGISEVSLQRTGETTFRADDGSGTEGDVQFLYRSPELNLIYAVGSYDGPLFHKPVRGGCLLLLRTGYIREPNGHYYVTSQLDAFFSLKHLGIEILAKTFQPLVGKSADYNFAESNNFLSTLSNTSESRPNAVQKLATQLTRVREEDRQKLVMLVESVHQKALERVAAEPGDKPPVPTYSRTPNRPRPQFRR